MTVAGIVSSLLSGCIIDALTRKSLVFAGALVICASTTGLMAVPGTPPWATTIVYGVGFGLTNGVYGVIFNVLLADVFGLEALGTLTGTLSLFGLSGMAIGPIMLSMLRESFDSFRPALLLLTVVTAAGAAMMAAVPYPRKAQDDLAGENEEERETLLTARSDG